MTPVTCVNALHPQRRGRRSIERLSVDSSRAQAALGGAIPESQRVASADGRLVVFASDSDDLVADDTNAAQDVFIAWGPAAVCCEDFESGDLSGWSSATD